MPLPAILITTALILYSIATWSERLAAFPQHSSLLGDGKYSWVFPGLCMPDE